MTRRTEVATQPLVSVLTPSFNQARWIADNLASVASQTYRHVEHVVADGGSTDGTVDILRRTDTPRIRWVTEPDDGQSAAINKAFHMSGGEIIGWLNSDDAYFSRNAISDAVAILSSRPEIDVVYGHAALVNADGLVLQVLWAPPMWRRLLAVHNFIVQPTVFVRRTAIEGADLVDRNFESMMDRELWLRLAARCRFARSDHIVAIDRHQPFRKVIVRRDLAERDRHRLAGMRRLPPTILARPMVRALNIGFRVIGATRIREVIGTDLAFAGRVDGIRPLLVRQLFRSRSSMPYFSPPRGGTRNQQGP